MATGARSAIAPLKVSVVVPVYNPGHHIDALIASLRRQSLASDEFEVVFVDDGSTDGTADRLDALAAEVSSFQVIHAPRSGWPGRPRNIGIEAARGEYIQFADNDDELGEEALERLYRFATKNGSDVVVGREIRTDRRFPYGLRLFAESHPRISLDDPRLLGPLSPHKLFRRRFLIDQGIRFPEAPRIFEDYAFVMQAYLLAGVISVLSDYPCYYWRERKDKTNAGEESRGRSYADTIEVIHRHTQPGPLRDRLLAHWYERRVLRFANAQWADDATDRVEERFGNWRKAAEQYFPVALDARLPGILRARSALVRAGDLERLRALARERVRLAHGAASLRAGRRQAVLTVEGWLSYADGSPVQTEAIDGRVRWRPPVDLGDAVPAELLDVTADLDDMQLQVLALRRGTGDAVLLPAVSRALDDGGRLGARADVRIGRAARGDRARTLYPGTWDLFIGLSAAGWNVRAPLRGDSFPKLGGSLDTTVAAAGQSIRFFTTDRGTVALTVWRDRPLRRFAALLPNSVRRALVQTRRKLCG